MTGQVTTVRAGRRPASAHRCGPAPARTGGPRSGRHGPAPPWSHRTVTAGDRSGVTDRTRSRRAPAARAHGPFISGRTADDVGSAPGTGYLPSPDDEEDRMTPIPDFDHLPLPAVSHRIRALDLAQLDELMEHEQAHGNRLPVLEVMRSRRRELEEGATRSGGDQGDVHPETGATA